MAFQNESVRYSVPEWIIDGWNADYGRDVTEKMLEAFMQPAKITVRTNTQKCTPEELKDRLSQEGVTVEAIEGISYAFALSGFDYLAGLGSFQDGGGWDVKSYTVVGEGTKRTTYSMPKFKAYVTIPDEESVDKAKGLIKKVMNGETITDSDVE